MLPANVPVLRAWAAFASTQWRNGMAGRSGLDYSAVMAALQAHKPRTWKRLFAGIRIIEHALLAVYAERREPADGNAN